MFRKFVARMEADARLPRVRCNAGTVPVRQDSRITHQIASDLVLHPGYGCRRSTIENEGAT